MTIPIPITQEPLVDDKRRITPVWQNFLRLLAQGKLNVGSPSLKTISAGVISVSTSFVSVNTEDGDPTDDLDTINGGNPGDILILVATDTDNSVVLKDGTGNLALNGDLTLDDTADTAVLIYHGSAWRELARSSNA